MYQYKYTVLLPDNITKVRVIYANSKSEVIEEIKMLFQNYINYNVEMLGVKAIINNKEIPMTPDPVMEDDYDNYTDEKYHLQNERYDYMYKCKSCGGVIFMDNYCSKCGQKLK
jgi:hypothetical protein